MIGVGFFIKEDLRNVQRCLKHALIRVVQLILAGLGVLMSSGYMAISINDLYDTFFNLTAL